MGPKMKWLDFVAHVNNRLADAGDTNPDIWYIDYQYKINDIDPRKSIPDVDLMVGPEMHLATSGLRVRN
jgi:hypothetical protein